MKSNNDRLHHPVVRDAEALAAESSRSGTARPFAPRPALQLEEGIESGDRLGAFSAGLVESPAPLPGSERAERSGRRFVRMFKPRFAALVAADVKKQTVRPVPKRMPQAGDEISLRMWTGKPYRSKQRVLAEATITKVETFELWVANPRVPRWNWKFIVGGRELNEDEWAQFSRADGFDFTTDLIDWFAENHGLPFTGIVIHWDRGLCEGACGICGGTRIRPLPKFADACECDLSAWAAAVELSASGLEMCPRSDLEARGANDEVSRKAD